MNYNIIYPTGYYYNVNVELLFNTKRILKHSFCRLTKKNTMTNLELRLLFNNLNGSHSDDLRKDCLRLLYILPEKSNYVSVCTEYY